jgi:uncharacterized protein YggE
MKKVSGPVLITGMIVIGIIVLALIAFAYYSSSNPAKTITSNGYATIKAMPDSAAIYFNIQTYGKTSSEANEENSMILEKMKNLLEAQGLSKDMVQTQGLSIYPEYDYSNGRSEIKRYVASHSVKIEIPVNDTEKVGNVIDSGVSAGAGISYINFEISQENQNSYKADAIRKATQDAKAKAEALAEGSGNKLGSLVSISTSDFFYEPRVIFSSATGKDVAEAKSSVSITPGEQEVSASVTAIFRIKQS